MYKLLDCTLRDGGYHNLWNFPPKVVNEYLQAMSECNIDIVEIGFRSSNILNTKGPLAFSDEVYLQTLNIPSNLKIAVMINASEFLNMQDSLESQVNKLLPNQERKSVVDFVRIACHINEFEDALPLSNLISKKGFKVGFNIMQFSELNEKLIKKFCKRAKNFPIDVLYFADSLGSLEPKDIERKISLIKSFWDRDIGIHTHDNLGLALLNSMKAIKCGVKYVDSTVSGMGRGPGNARTEELLFETKEIKGGNLNFSRLSKIIFDYFKPLQKELEWGSNFFYFLAGKKKIHPTYIQEILKNHTLNNNDILTYIDYLDKIDSRKFRPNLLKLVKENKDYSVIKSTSVKLSELINKIKIISLRA